MTYLLDTNVVISLLKGHRSVRDELRRAIGRGESIAVSSVALFERWYGVARSARREDNAERLRVFLSGNINVVPFEDQDAKFAGGLRAALEARGRPLGAHDLLIAAQAIRTKATIVTANVTEVARVPDLLWEDWTGRA